MVVRTSPYQHGPSDGTTMYHSRRRTLALLTTTVMTVGLAPAFGSAAGADGGAKPPGAAKAAHGLPLGAADLPETRTTRRVQRGVTVTSIVRGVPDTTDVWTVEVSSPDAGNPDPDAPAVAITDEAEARTSAADLTSKGFDPRVEAVQTPRTADTGGLLGYRVRVGGSTDKAQADQLDAQVVATGHKASVVYTGWDADAGAQPSRGTWHLTVVRVDPRRFTGTVRGDYGPDFVNRETTSSLARSAGATVAVNAGFFVLDPAAGAPGDPAGVGVYRGHIESETTNGRPALILHSDARRTQIKRLWWRGRLLGRGDRSLRLTGLNRVPGLVRNCGVPGAEPTARPQQDVTCTRSSDTIAFDHAYGATTPTGLGAEVVLDRQGRVV
ncbi:MAG: hypothetical protein JWO46_950, partial [Nocardioidaceae bacterium]|nr:hypothetical protein [Nocardioidaceae bacterium]